MPSPTMQSLGQNAPTGIRWGGWIVACAIVVAALKCVLGGYWGVLADEAYYWVWAQHPSLGYYDQPPFFAWMLTASTSFSDTSLGLRVVPIACGVVAPWLVMRAVRGTGQFLLWWICVPSLTWLTLFATPDATLLGAWAVAFAAAIQGGRWWIVVGIAAAAAFLSKYSGLAILPLLLVSAGPGDWRQPWPWLGAAAFAALVMPHIFWLDSNEWISILFQLGEGWATEKTPGVTGPLIFFRDQLAVASPILLLILLFWWIRSSRQALLNWRMDGDDRVLRMAWWTSAPVWVFFAFSSAFGTPEAHWAAPAYIGGGLGVIHFCRAGRRLLSAGLALGGIGSLVVMTHGLYPWIPLDPDPGARLREGPALGRMLTELTGDMRDRAIRTERYQEAALIHYYTGLKAQKLWGCGRVDQYDLWPQERAGGILFVRPTRSSNHLCVDTYYQPIGEPLELRPEEGSGPKRGSWQVFQLDDSTQ